MDVDAELVIRLRNDVSFSPQEKMVGQGGNAGKLAKAAGTLDH